MLKDHLIKGIHLLVSHNVIGDKQAFNRYKGFRAELMLEDYIRNKYPVYDFIEGGIIISKDSNVSSLENSVYITLIPDYAYSDVYVNLYKKLKSIGFAEMFIILYSAGSWTSKNIMEFEDGTITMDTPEISIKQFDTSSEIFEDGSDDIEKITGLFERNSRGSKNRYTLSRSSEKWLMDNLTPFSREQILQIYMNRILLDGLIGFGLKKGKPSDIDFILMTPSGEFRLIEIKEKDLPKKNTRGFGLDVPRLNDLLRISDTTGLKYFLTIRQIDNQTDRAFLSWRKIDIKDFDKGVEGAARVKGGTGMRSIYSHNDTLICPLELFDTF